MKENAGRLVWRVVFDGNNYRIEKRVVKDPA